MCLELAAQQAHQLPSTVARKTVPVALWTCVAVILMEVGLALAFSVPPCPRSAVDGNSCCDICEGMASLLWRRPVSGVRSKKRNLWRVKNG